MPSATIRRGGGKGVRRAASARATRAKVDAAKKKSGGILGPILAAIPGGERTLQRLFLLLIVLALLAIGWLVASAVGLPQLVAARAAVIAEDGGYRVRHVEIRGVKRMDSKQIYDQVLAEQDQAMTRLDLDAIRDRLRALPWVADARVSRQLPDTLVVDVVERVPTAVLQRPGGLVLIDADGHELEAVSPERAKGMLVLSGANANGQAEALHTLLGSAPALKEQVRTAEWIGNRRWNLTFATGQVLALPEGDEEAASALVTFARMDGVNRLLGGKVAAFDMRVPDQIYMRVPGSGSATPTPAKN